MDIYEEGSLTPRIEYEVYDSKTKEQLDLSICNHTKINILIPAVIEKDNINKYNSSHEYYNDIFYTYTTDNGTDITLTDRKNEFISNNMSLCESKCEYGGYDSDINKAKCECEVKIKIPLMSEITIDSNIFKKKIDIKNALNIKIMKCYKTSFSKKGLKRNIGSYIILSFIFTVTICLFLFLFKGFSVLKQYINAINFCKNINNNIITGNFEKKSGRNLRGKGKRKKKGKKRKRKQKRKQKKIKKHPDVKIKVELNSNVLINNNNEVKVIDKNNKSEPNRVEYPPKKNRKGFKINNIISNIKTSGDDMPKGKSSSLLELNNNKKEKTKTSSV